MQNPLRLPLSLAAIVVSGMILAACADAPPPNAENQCRAQGHVGTSLAFQRCVDRINAEQAAKKTASE